MRQRAVLVAIAASVAAACGGGAGQGSRAVTVPLGPTWTSVWLNVIGPRCSACHSGTGLGATLGGLTMSTQSVASANLVGVASSATNASVTVSPRPLLVDPGSPSTSLLYLKVSGPPAGYGARMPYLEAPLSPAEVAAIEGWIASGASNSYLPP
jgi:hypothetical protein